VRVGPLPRRVRAGLITAGIVAVFWWSLSGTRISLLDIAAGVPDMLDFLRRMYPPDAAVAPTALLALVETVQMTFLGTSLGAIVALPLAFSAARNLSSPWVTALSRGLLNLARTVPSILWALFFAASVGLGPMAGVLALTFYSMGMLGKLYYETLEAIEPGPVEAVAGTGAHLLHVYRYAVLPQALPHLASHTLFGYEYNIRHATVLGLVGAGGLGFYLLLYVRTFQYEKVAMAFLLLLAVVMAVDWVSGLIRRRLV
jgi:phosphonate transport system permease protein